MVYPCVFFARVAMDKLQRGVGLDKFSPTEITLLKMHNSIYYVEAIWYPIIAIPRLSHMLAISMNSPSFDPSSLSYY